MKILIENYTFDASAKTITFDDYAAIELASVLLITNTTDNIIIYNFASPAKGGVVATNVLTLIYNTTPMSDTDKLQIYYDDPAATAAVNPRTDGIVALEVNDDFTSFESFHQTLTLATDTTITFSQPVRMVKVLNWDSSNRVLVRDGAITSNTDSGSARVGKAPATDVPNSYTFILKTSTIHLRSAANSEVTVIGSY